MYDYGYNYGYDSYDYSSTASAVGIFAGVGIFMWIIGMAVAVFSVICMWKLFKKAGKPGWASIVPIYNMIVMIEIAELPMWYIALFFVPFANIYAMFKIYIEIAHKFGKSTGFGVGMVFLNIIFIPMLAFGKAEYKGGISAPINGNINKESNIQVNQAINNNASNINNQPDIMNVNSNITNASIMDVNTFNNNSTFQPIGNVSNNVSELTSVNTIESSVPSAQDVNVMHNNVVEPMNNTSVNPVNEVPTNTAIEDNIPTPIIPNVSVGNVGSTNSGIESINNMKKTCPNCGNQVQFDAMFCTNCGHNL